MQIGDGDADRRQDVSYSRWGGSRWYTFWACQDDDTENRDSAIFEICAVASFTAKELREDIERCIARAVETELILFAPVDSAEKEELREYMQEFLRDVDREYPEKTEEASRPSAARSENDDDD